MLRSMPNLPFMTRMYHVRSKKPQKSGEVTPSYGIKVYQLHPFTITIRNWYIPRHGFTTVFINWSYNNCMVNIPLRY